MAVVGIGQGRPRPERYDEHLARLSELKRILERLGARVRVVTTAVGGEPGAISVITEVDDWPQYGELRAKAAADSELQALLARFRTDPTGEMIQTSIAVDVPLPA